MALKKKKKKKKLKSVAKVAEEAAVLLQLLVRLKASDDNGYCSCCTCGVTRHFSDDMQGGHFISRIKTAHKLLEENINPQCAKCNGFLDGNHIPYTLYMVDMYGRDFVDELEATKNQTRKWIRHELEDEIKNLKEQIEEQKKRVCGVMI